MYGNGCHMQERKASAQRARAEERGSLEMDRLEHLENRERARMMSTSEEMKRAGRKTRMLHR
jgi:hypothetical protein